MIKVILEILSAVQVCMADGTLSGSWHTHAFAQYPRAASGNQICGLTSDLHLGMLHLPRESVSEAASHLKKSLTIKSRSKGWVKMVAEQHGSSYSGWNSNVFCCVAVSFPVSHPLSGKDLTWDSNTADNVGLLLSESVNGKIHSNTEFTEVHINYLW